METENNATVETQWLWYAKFDDMGWDLCPLDGKSSGQAMCLAKADFEVVYTNDIEPYKKTTSRIDDLERSLAFTLMLLGTLDKETFKPELWQGVEEAKELLAGK